MSNNDSSSTLAGSTTSSGQVEGGHCTAALPGQVFQDIYICRRCCAAAEGTCICQACAETCHAHCRISNSEDEDEDDEAVEYVGVGPAACDCHALRQVGDSRCEGDGLLSSQSSSTCGCKLYESSLVFAENQNLRKDWDASCTLPRNNDTLNDDPVQVYDMLSLQQEPRTAQQVMISQAQLLVQHSKETFWIDASTASGDMKSLSLLERLALDLLQFHSQNKGVEFRGAEWWVQVKENLRGPNPSSAAIEMHYDKDEVLVESFGLGVFPTYSTVTYLTRGRDAAPTLIFPHTYHDPPDHKCSHAFASQPMVGKHLVFDGALLHGAIPLKHSFFEKAVEDEDTLRVTFLVNLWTDHRPMGIKPLAESIRNALIEDVNTSEESNIHFPMTLCPRAADIPHVLAESQVFMNLPFVEDGMIVKSVTLPNFETGKDVVRIDFQEGFEAHLDYPDSPRDGPSDEDDEVY